MSRWNLIFTKTSPQKKVIKSETIPGIGPSIAKRVTWIMPKEVLDTKYIQKATGVQTKITRPPYGAINNAIQYSVGPVASSCGM